MEQLQRRLESAIRAMSDVDEAMRSSDNPEELQRAASEAQRQLEGARDQATEEMRRAMQASLDNLADRAEELYEDQRAMEDRLQESIRGVNVGRNDLNRLESGMSILEEYELAQEKRQLQTAVQGLEQDARNTAQQLAESEPAAAEQIREALDKLREEEVETRIAVAASYIEIGEAVYVAGSESAVTEALRELQQDLERARSMADGGRGGEPGENEGQGGGIQQTLAETRELRRQLQAFAEGDTANGGATRQGRDDLQQTTGIEIGDIEMTREFDRSADNISEEILAMFRELRGRGVPVQEIDELRRLASQIRASEWSGNPELLEQEARLALSRVEQLEIALARAVRTDNSVRTTTAEEIPEAHREIVADYYRRLGKADDESGQ